MNESKSRLPSFLSDKNRLQINLFAIIIAFAVFFTLMKGRIAQGEFISDSGSVMVVTTLFAFILAIIGWYFGIYRGVRTDHTLFILLAVGLSLYVRFAFYDVRSGDYNSFLNGWVEQIGSYEGVSAWKEKIGDYNMPYLYILTLVAKSGQPPLYMIKWFSMIFDYMLAFYVMKLASLRLPSVGHQIAVFCTVLFMPTVLINSSFWAQCDAVYTAISVAALYYGMTKRSIRCVVLFAIAFSFKLQTIFLLPILGVLLFTKRVKWSELVYFPTAFLAMMLPAILAGRSIYDTFSIYFGQMAQYERLSLNAPNIYRLLGDNADNYFKFLSTAGIFIAGAGVLGILFFIWKKRHLVDDRAILTTSFILVLMIPLLLPRMHERYYFMSDIFALFIFLYNKKRWMLPMLVSFVSIRSYLPFLFGYGVNFMYLAVILVGVLGFVVYDAYVMMRKAECSYQPPLPVLEVELDTESEIDSLQMLEDMEYAEDLEELALLDGDELEYEFEPDIEIDTEQVVEFEPDIEIDTEQVVEFEPDIEIDTEQEAELESDIAYDPDLEYEFEPNMESDTELSEDDE